MPIQQAETAQGEVPEAVRSLLKEKLETASKTLNAKNANPSSYFSILFYLLLEAMTVREHTVMTQSKELTANAAIQNNLNNWNGEIKFSILPPNAKTATMTRIQDENEEYAALKGDIQDDLITARQRAQIMMTQTSTNVDLLEQDTSQNTAWLKVLYTIFQVIDEMTKNS